MTTLLDIGTTAAPAGWAADEGPLLGSAVIRFEDSDIGVGAVRDDLRRHLAAWGQRRSWWGGADRLREWVAAVGLTGRGGAHFPVARRWASAMAAGPGGTVVVNAAEGEPAAAKDASLLQFRPHLVLDGAVDLAEALAAREIVVWVHAGARASLASLRHALAERAAHGLDLVPMRVLTGPDAYVAGEASSVISAVRGGRPLPTTVTDPARPWGDGPPVLVHNAETLARVAMLARTGPHSYVGSSLVTVTVTSHPGVVASRTVVEASPGEPLAAVVARAGYAAPRAVLVGGYAGTWRAWEDLAHVPVDPESLRRVGASLGAGVVLLLPSGRSLLAETTAIAGYLAAESAQQCGPCMFGLPATVRALRGGEVGRVRSLLPLVEGRGACRHPDGAARMVRSALDLSTAWGEVPR